MKGTAKKGIIGLAVGASVLTGGTIAENAAFDRANQYEVRDERVADNLIEVKDRISDAEVTLNRWDGEESLTIRRSKDQSKVPFVRLLEVSRREHTIARATTTDGVYGFEFDIELTGKPDTNVFTYEMEGWEDLLFVYQSQGWCGLKRVDCPENVIGSYAVYHKEKRDNQYGTGKLYQIYRPLIHDADGNETWGALSYDDGRLSVTAPPDFLDEATYPVTVDPTFGYTSAGASFINLLSGELVGSLASAPSTENIDSISAYVSLGTTASASVKGILVAHATHNIVTNGIGGAVDVTDPASWRTSTYISKPTVMSGVNYDIAIVWSEVDDFGDDSGIFVDSSGGDNMFYDFSNNYGSPTDPTAGDHTTFPSLLPSIYATYTASSGGAAPAKQDVIIFD